MLDDKCHLTEHRERHDRYISLLCAAAGFAFSAREGNVTVGKLRVILGEESA